MDESSYTYTDNILEMVLVTAAKYVKQEIIGYSDSYTIDYDPATITPDPSNDDVYCNFVVMKAACLMNQQDFKNKINMSGVAVKLGPISMDTGSLGSNVLMALLNSGYCAAYAELKKQYNMGEASVSVIKAILGPYSHGDLDIPNSSHKHYRGF